MTRIVWPAHLRRLARIDGEVTLTSPGQSPGGLWSTRSKPATRCCGTIRDQATKQRSSFIRFFACEEDLSHEQPDARLPGPVVSRAEPYLIVRAMAGG
jgi:molybdopterin synthase sulfur carrier subunit